MLAQVLHTQSEVLMVMEYVEGGDLLEVLNTQARFVHASKVQKRTPSLLPFTPGRRACSCSDGYRKRCDTCVACCLLLTACC